MTTINLIELRDRNKRQSDEALDDYFLGADIDQTGVDDLWIAYDSARRDRDMLLQFIDEKLMEIISKLGN